MQKFGKRFSQEVCLHFILSGFSLLVLWDERPGKRVCLFGNTFLQLFCHKLKEPTNAYIFKVVIFVQISRKYSFGFLKMFIYYFYPFFRIFDRDNTGRTLVNVLIFVNVTLSHQAHVAYFVLNDLTKVNRTRKMCLV